MAQVPRISLGEAELRALGKEFVGHIAKLEGDRSDLLAHYKTWSDNYAGNVRPSDSEKPFEGASEAHLPATATDVDSVVARLMAAVFGQAPQFVVRALSAKWVEFARQTQQFSQYLESGEIPVYDMILQAFLILTKFGSVVIYLPWVRQPVKFMDTQEDGTQVENVEDIADRPCPMVIHPKDWLQPYAEKKSPQETRWCGYRYKLDPGQLRAWIKQDFFDRETGEKLLRKIERPEGDKMGTPTDARQDIVQRREEINAGIAPQQTAPYLDMVHLYARMDIDGDGQDEQVNFHMEEGTGCIARLAYDHYAHRRRPFVDLHYFPREGVWYSIGIPEMLEAIQKNMDITMRQVQDANTIRNTSNLKAKLNGAVQPGEPFMVNKIWFVHEMDELDVLPINTGGANLQLNDINIFQSWEERRTGMSDAAKGQTGSETATMGLAALQEAAKRIDMVIGGLRKSLAELWLQILELYAEFKPVTEFPMEHGEYYSLEEWRAGPVREFRKRVAIKASVSTAALNKAIAQEQTRMLLSEYMSFNSSVAGLVQQYLTVQDPRLKEFFLQMLLGGRELMKRHLDQFEWPDMDKILPDPKEYLDASQLPEPINPAAILPGGGGQEPMGAPQELLEGGGGGVAPATAPNRPVQGLPRIPGVTSSIPGTPQSPGGLAR